MVVFFDQKVMFDVVDGLKKVLTFFLIVDIIFLLNSTLGVIGVSALCLDKDILT
jgi:hypothetical protein